MYIELTKGYQAIVDGYMYKQLIQYNWYVLDSHPRIRYASRWLPGIKNPRKTQRMHHAVMNVTAEYLSNNFLVVDHEDRDGLNNQIDNLRIVSRRDNALNSARCNNAIGIYWDSIRVQYKVMELQPKKKFICWSHTLEEAMYVKGFT